MVRLQLKLELICDEGDEFGIRWFALSIGNRVAEEPLEGIQIPSVPGDFDGMADGAFYAAGCGLECFRHLGIEHLGDGVGVPYGPPGGLAGCS